MRFKIVLVNVALTSVLGLPAHAQGPAPAPAAPLPPPTRTVRPVTNFVPVTDQIIQAPKPENWLIYRGNYQGWGYSALDRINKGNVRNLQLVWSRAIEPGTNQATPLLYNGVMYLGIPGDVIQAIDAATGDLMWEYRHRLPEPGAMNPLGQRKRAIALYDDNVYTVTQDNFVLALNARTGEKAWQTDRGGDGCQQLGGRLSPTVVVAGSTCQYAGQGCYVTGHDARTGGELWRNTMIPAPASRATRRGPDRRSRAAG
jgi:alcohol dehydrogenase (cytochrome c)